MFIVIFGNLLTGFTAAGPFKSRASAQDYAESNGTVMELAMPTRATVEGDTPAPGYIGEVI